MPADPDNAPPASAGGSADKDGAGTAADQGSLGRSIGLTALSTLLPGLGLAFTRRRVLGIGIFAAFLLLGSLTWWYVASHGLLHAAANAVDGKLGALMALIVVGAVVWIGAIALTAYTTRPHTSNGPPAPVLQGFVALMALLVAVPAGAAFAGVNTTRNAVPQILTGPISSSTTSAKPTHSSTPTPPTINPTLLAVKSRLPKNFWKDTSRVNLLFIGSDAGPDRTGVRTDALMVASVDTKNAVTTLIGIPRNLENLPFPASNPLHTIWPNGFNCGAACILDAVWTQASQHANLFPKSDSNPGLSTTRDVVSNLLGLRIDHTVVADLSGFPKLVDAMGGVVVTVHQRLPIGGVINPGVGIVPGSIHGWIDPGKQRLKGKKALWFTRSRATTNDFSRMRRQRCMIGAVLDQVNPVKMLASYPSLVKTLRADVRIDITPKELPAFAELVQRIQKSTIRSLPLTPNNISTTRPSVSAIRALVSNAINGKAVKRTSKAAAADDGVSNVADAC